MHLLHSLSTFMVLAALAQPAGVSASPLEGLWRGVIVRATAQPEASLTLSRTDGTWTSGALDGVAGKLETDEGDGGLLSFIPAEGEGRFSRSFSADGSVRGFWIEAGHAAPMVLKGRSTHGGGSLKGTRRVYNQNLTFFINIHRDGDGILRADIHNPERNQGAFLSISDVVEKEDSVIFRGREPGSIVAGGTIDGDEMELSFGFDDAKVTFIRVEPEKEEEFLPRLPGRPASYSPPASMPDGWRVSNAASAGLDQSRLDVLLTEIQRQSFKNVQGLLIARGGALVLEEYFYGFTAGRPHDMRSAGKSVSSALVGVALQRGWITSIDEPVYAAFGDAEKFANPDRRKKDVTVHHFLTMSSGLDCWDWDDSSPGQEDRMQGQDEQPDWARYILDLPMVADPGTLAHYCTGGVNVVGRMIADRAGRPTYEILDEALFSPMGITDYFMNITPLGNGFLGGGLKMKPRDWLKFGQLYLQGGVWEGQQLLSEKWIAESWKPRVGLNSDSPEFGYWWWYDRFDIGDEAVDAYSAQGNGGQFIFVVPKLEMVVVITGGNYARFRDWIVFKNMLRDYILPAAG